MQLKKLLLLFLDSFILLFVWYLITLLNILYFANIETLNSRNENNEILFKVRAKQTL